VAPITVHRCCLTLMSGRGWPPYGKGYRRHHQVTTSDRQHPLEPRHRGQWPRGHHAARRGGLRPQASGGSLRCELGHHARDLVGLLEADTEGVGQVLLPKGLWGLRVREGGGLLGQRWSGVTRRSRAKGPCLPFRQPAVRATQAGDRLGAARRAARRGRRGASAGPPGAPAGPARWRPSLQSGLEGTCRRGGAP
jgi:hypothetical protein